VCARCFICGGSLGRTRLVVNGLWLCPDCLYRSEHGEPPAPKQPSPVRRGAPQEERLFPLEPYTRRKSDG
jgi:hypothetical protein